jgi:hypothetical protein
LPETTYLPVVIAGLDPVIPSDSGGYGDARIKSEHDGEGMDCLCPDLILMPMGACPAMTTRYGSVNENFLTRPPILMPWGWRGDLDRPRSIGAQGAAQVSAKRPATAAAATADAADPPDQTGRTAAGYSTYRAQPRR